MAGEAFNWPPTPDDLEHIAVVECGSHAPVAGSAGRPSRVPQPPAVPLRLHGRAVERVALLCAGLLVGGAWSTWRGDAPTPVAAAMAAPVIPRMSAVGPVPEARVPAARGAGRPSGEVGRARGTRGNVPAGGAPIVEVIRQYARAHSRLDAADAHRVQPAMAREVLVRQFTGLREQRLDLAPCTVTVTGPRAQASCPGTLRFRPRKGQDFTRVIHGRWDFTLTREDTRWVIARVTSR